MTRVFQILKDITIIICNVKNCFVGFISICIKNQLIRGECLVFRAGNGGQLSVCVWKTRQVTTAPSRAMEPRATHSWSGSIAPSSSVLVPIPFWDPDGKTKRRLLAGCEAQRQPRRTRQESHTATDTWCDHCIKRWYQENFHVSLSYAAALA